MTILERALVWDNHTCLPLRPGDERFLPELARLRAAGVDVVGINVGFGEQSVEHHLRVIAHFRRWLSRRPDEYVLIRSVNDVARAKATGRLAVFFDIEGAGAVDDQLSLVAMYYDLGVRWMLIAYNRGNRAGSGCMDAHDGGLTDFGAALVAEMNRVGMIVCVSHTGERTAFEAIERSNAPVILSHSNARALHDHPRNVRDGLIRACARRGGVVGINGIGPFLGDGDLVDAWARHVDYVAKLVGVDHVAISLDYVFDTEELLDYLRAHPHLFGSDASRRGPDDFACVAPESIGAAVDALVRLGYAESDLEKILGLNWLRVAEAVWK